MKLIKRGSQPASEPRSLWGTASMGRGFGGPMAPEEQDQSRRTFAVIALLVLCLFGGLLLRLWFLQLVRGEELQHRSETNRIRQLDRKSVV